MKKTYLKPATEEILISSKTIMITASGDGQRIVDDGGTTSDENITEGDSRRRYQNVWDEEEYDDEEDW